jgi:hypothetical protein
MTRTAQKGIYIVILFKKDMSGFYLTLNQGITFFQERFKTKKYEYAHEVAKYFRDQIAFEGMNFKTNEIELGSNQQLAKGYIPTTICQKYYDIAFDVSDFFVDLNKLLNIYNDIIDHMDPTSSYEDAIKNVILGFDEKQLLVKADEAIGKIFDEVKNLITIAPDQHLQSVQPYKEKTLKLERLSQPILSKIDYVKKAQINAANGANGERLALEFEIKRLENLIFTKKINEKYLDKIFQVSAHSDSYGYDIVSYDVDRDGKVHEIYIEVKTTSNKKDTSFFVSKNELEKSRKFQDRYYVYRVYDCNSVTPKFYSVNGAIDTNFVLDPITFQATYKYYVR